MIRMANAILLLNYGRGGMGRPTLTRHPFAEKMQANLPKARGTAYLGNARYLINTPWIQLQNLLGHIWSRYACEVWSSLTSTVLNQKQVVNCLQTYIYLTHIFSAVCRRIWLNCGGLLTSVVVTVKRTPHFKQLGGQTTAIKMQALKAVHTNFN